MIGSIIGDIVGSVYDFNNNKTKKFEFFNPNGSYTDDSVLTFATANWLLHGVRKKEAKGRSETTPKRGCPLFSASLQCFSSVFA